MIHDQPLASGYEGIYTVLALSLLFLAYGVADIAGGSGFLAVYLTGLLMGKQQFLHKHSLLRVDAPPTRARQ